MRFDVRLDAGCQMSSCPRPQIPAPAVERTENATSFLTSGSRGPRSRVFSSKCSRLHSGTYTPQPLQFPHSKRVSEALKQNETATTASSGSMRTGHYSGDGPDALLPTTSPIDRPATPHICDTDQNRRQLARTHGDSTPLPSSRNGLVLCFRPGSRLARLGKSGSGAGLCQASQIVPNRLVRRRLQPHERAMVAQRVCRVTSFGDKNGGIVSIFGSSEALSETCYSVLLSFPFSILYSHSILAVSRFSEDSNS